MRILLSNDDGFEAPGLHALATALRKMGTVYIAAPARHKSGASSALTLNTPVRVHRMAPRQWAVEGNPADAVKVALRELLPKRPDFVVSGQATILDRDGAAPAPALGRAPPIPLVGEVVLEGGQQERTEASPVGLDVVEDPLLQQLGEGVEEFAAGDDRLETRIEEDHGLPP